MEYNVPWSVIFPIIIAIAYGKIYGLISGLAGGAFYGFVLWPEEGAANGLTALFFLILLWLCGQAAQNTQNKNDRKILFRFLRVLLYIPAGLTIIYILYDPVLSLNAKLDSAFTIRTFDASVLLNFWIKDLVNFIFLVIAAELFLTIPSVRKLLGLPAKKIMRKNTSILMQTLGVALLIWIIFLALSKSLTNSPEKVQSGYISIAFLTILYSSLVVARILIRNVNKHLKYQYRLSKQNNEFLSLNEKLNETNSKLIQAKEKAEQSDRLKTAFLTNITHEIRTPLNGIMGFSELLQESIENPEHKRYSRLILQSSKRLLLTINDVLDIAKIEAGELNINIRKININELCRELYSFFSEQKFSFNFLLNLPEETVFIYSDKTKLYQILNNLLGNAVKFTQKGYVSLSCQKKAGGIQFEIKDTGCGINPEDQNLIFQRFGQSERVRQSKNSGTGLGLTIAKEFTELLGGKIWFESDYGKGTSFYVELPEKTKPEQVS